ncbi:MAG: transposase [Prevotella sp.]|nr:transposase [Prevotella sp.]MDY5667443.1 transposase [Alloprevotella sp.]
MRKKPTKYTHEERLALLREYHESGMSKYRFAKEKGFSSQIMLSVWIKKYESEEKSLVLPSEESEKDMAQKSKVQLREDNEHLRKRIKELEKALEVSHLETKARDMLIDKAEELFDIPIRKKSGVK